jgi:hypothetical protein
MVIYDLYITRPFLVAGARKAYPPFVVDPYAVLPSAVSPQRLKAIARQKNQSLKSVSRVKHPQSSFRLPAYNRPLFYIMPVIELFDIRVFVALDHRHHQ